jgi:sporulation integral membrane protein YtvI
MQNFEHSPTVKRKRFLINFAFFALIFAISIVVIRFALPALFPFVVAFIVTLILRPIVRFLHAKLKMNTRFVSVVLVILFYGTIGVLVIWMIIELVSFLADKVKDLPSFFQNQIRPFLVTLFAEIQKMLHNFDPEVAIDFDATANSLLSSLGSTVMSISGQFVGKLTDIAVSVPTFLLNIVIMVVATIFLIVDYESIRTFIKRQLPDKTNALMHNIASHLGGVVKKYLLSYSLIMLITFGEIFAGLSIIGVKYSALLAALIAIFDILPVVGSGLVLVPWAIISLIIGNIGLGVGLFILWAIVCVVRQIIEPKIVGDQLGLNPIISIIAIYLGYRWFGFAGMLLMPATCALAITLHNKGVITLYKESGPVDENRERERRESVRLEKTECRRKRRAEWREHLTISLNKERKNAKK